MFWCLSGFIGMEYQAVSIQTKAGVLRTLCSNRFAPCMVLLNPVPLPTIQRATDNVRGLIVRCITSCVLCPRRGSETGLLAYLRCSFVTTPCHIKGLVSHPFILCLARNPGYQWTFCWVGSQNPYLDRYRTGLWNIGLDFRWPKGKEGEA